MDLFIVLLAFTLQTLIHATNETSNDSECILTDIKSRLNIGSHIIDSAKEKLPKGLIDPEAENETSTSYECIFMDIKSHLSWASKIIETAKEKIPKDVKELCKEFIGKEIKDVTDNPKPLDCSDIYLSGERRDGVYNIWPERGTLEGSRQVYCDMESNGGGWTVIQRRGDYGSPENYFVKGWHAYKIGFGSRMKDFWIGNENLFVLTNQRLYQLRVNLTAWDGSSAYSIYDEFSISNENGGYRLDVSAYSGTGGDSLKFHNGHKFTTKDKNNDVNRDRNCAQRHKGAWWFANCKHSSLNGLYLRPNNASRDEGVQWYHFKNNYHSLKGSVMKIRPADFTHTSNII